MRVNVPTTERSEIDDRVADELPRRVIGHVPATTHLEDLDALRTQRGLTELEILAVGAATEGDDGRMLEQEQPVARTPREPVCYGLALKGECLGVGLPAEPLDRDRGRPRGRRLSVALPSTQRSNSAASRISRIRWRKPLAGAPSTAR